MDRTVERFLMRSLPLIAALACALSGAAAHAADVGGPVGAAPWGALEPARQAPLLSELRLGAVVHDPLSPESGAVDVKAEVLFDPFGRAPHTPYGWLTPRVHVGATGNFTGHTSLLYAGFTWTFDITRRWFVEGAFGGTVHTGSTGPLPVAGENAMGCRTAFHESAALGYRFSAQWSVMLTVEHASNAGLCVQNRGLTNAGFKVAYTF
ncbi:MAG: hypothetical protein JWN93_1866 [Hyphomicrobiales bacterium]|nr:hypothetical protein [Hyphomicrobiales bacterium]